MSQIKVGFVGYGGSAKTYHLPYLLPVKEFQVYAFLQRAAAPPPAVAKHGSHCTVDFPDARHYRNAEDFFADADIELVVVTTHPDTHASFAELALKANKHGQLQSCPWNCRAGFSYRFLPPCSRGREAIH